MKASLHFMIIDDDETDNYISQRIIKKILDTVDITVFTEAGKALEHIKTEYSKPGAPETILFLDTNMFDMSGWEFLDHFEKLDSCLKQLFTIYILSASDDPRDKERASSNKSVSGYVVKPVTKRAVFSALLKKGKKVGRNA